MFVHSGGQLKVQLIIERNDQGQVLVSGPIGDKSLCYALLECARDAIKDFTDRAAQQRVQLAQPGDIPDTSRDRRLSLDAPLRNGA